MGVQGVAGIFLSEVIFKQVRDQMKAFKDKVEADFSLVALRGWR